MTLPHGAIDWSAVRDYIVFSDHTHLLFNGRRSNRNFGTGADPEFPERGSYV